MKRAIIVFSLFAVISCTEGRARFHEGQLVTAVVSGDKGMVIRVRPRNGACRYTVRFDASQSHTDARWGADGPITKEPLAAIPCMREYELTEFDDVK